MMNFLIFLFSTFFTLSCEAMFQDVQDESPLATHSLFSSAQRAGLLGGGDPSPILDPTEQAFMAALNQLRAYSFNRTCFISHVYNPRTSNRPEYDRAPGLYEYHDVFYLFLSRSLEASGFRALLDMNDIRDAATVQAFCDQARDSYHIVAVMTPYYKTRHADLGSGVRREYDHITNRRNGPNSGR